MPVQLTGGTHVFTPGSATPSHPRPPDHGATARRRLGMPREAPEVHVPVANGDEVTVLCSKRALRDGVIEWRTFGWMATREWIRRV